MSLKALSDYTIYARYAHYLPEKKRRETWEEITDRVFDMHARKYAKQLEKSAELRAEFEFAKDMVKKRRVLGSQRALQFGGKWIESHETKLFNCLGVETEFITSEGVKSFRDFVDGQEITVLTHEGRWKRAVVRCYGEQKLNVLTFNRRGDYSTVRATANHTWLLKDGTRTQDVAIGDKLLGAPNIFAQFDYDDASPLERLYWCYGYTFGDGTLIIGKDGQRKHSMVRLCKNEIDYRYRFEQMGFSTTTSASLKGDFIAFTGTYLKTLPDPKVDSPELLRAFIRGLLDADGAKTGTQREAPEGSLFHSIQSSYPAAIAFLRTMLPVAGFYITGEDDYTGQETNFGVRPYTIRFRGMTSVNRKNGPAFYVSDIQEGPIEPVWCLEVEDDHSFVLKNGVVTGNCSYTYIDRPQVFQEIDYLLLCGCGVGFSVQKHHVKALPKIDNIVKNKVVKHVIEDSIEGWADAAGALINSYFVDSPIWSDYKGKRVEFDYSLIRPAGALIAGQFKAPGPKGLEAALEKIRTLIERRLASAEFTTDEFAGKLRPIDTYDIVMHISDSVLSGGIRRSATISLFSYDDKDMMAAKTGDWYISNPQRGRSNNSVLLVREETTWEQFKEIIDSTKQFGEPGFYFSSSKEHGANPCYSSRTRILTTEGWRSFSDLIGTQPNLIQDSRVQGVLTDSGEEWDIDLDIPNEGVINQAVQVGLTATNQDLFKLTLACGRTVEATSNHHFATKEGMKMMKDLTEDDEILIGLPPLANISKESYDFKLGYLAGHIMGDGCFLLPKNASVRFNIWGDENIEEVKYIEKIVAETISANIDSVKNYNNIASYTPVFNRDESVLIGNKSRYGLHSSMIYQIFEKLGFTSKEDLKWIHTQGKDFKAGFVSGLIYTDGHTEWNKNSRSLTIRISSVLIDSLREIQLILQELGIFSRINLSREAGYSILPDNDRNGKRYKTLAGYRLIVGGQQNCFNLLEISRLHPKDVSRIEQIRQDPKRRPTKQHAVSRVVSMEWIGKEDVFCLKEDNRRTLISEGMTARRCVEIGLYPKTKDKRSGVQFCNLCEINGKWCDSEDKFLEACRAASIIGTLQAGYTNFKYLSPESSEITAQEALLGVSITGVMDNPEVLLSPKTQRMGAAKCKEVNKRIAELIGINAAARITCTKPAGSTSCVLQTASGIHPHHARRYLRRVQANELEFPLQHFKSVNPDAVEPSVWSANGTDDVISFVCEVPKGAILKNDLSATELLAKVKSSQINWVLNGENPELCLSKNIHHNISNTINVRPDEWDKVAKYIYDNREYFTGISLLSSSGDLDYPQAPFATVLTPEEIVREYGDGSILASGLVVDGLHAFGGNLWAACDAALGFGEKIDEGQEEPEQPKKPRNKGFKSEKAYANALADYAIELNLFYQKMGEYRQINLKLDWIRRAKQFADRHFGGDLRRATYCLKHVSLWHTWLNLKRTYKEIDWSTVVEETQDHVAADTLGAQACAGGKCLV